MADRKATASWQGDIKSGKGKMRFADYEGQFSYSSRFEEGTGTNPEELLGAAHAGCYAMSVSSALGRAGYTPESIEVTAKIALRRIDGKATIVNSHIICRAIVPGISEEEFKQIAETSREGCTISRALAGVEITLEAELVKG
jgi:osmotically inducible protein OsmC